MPEEATGIVLAGGGSTRMGRDKAQVELGGQTLLARVLGPLKQVCSEVLVVTSPEGLVLHQGADSEAHFLADLMPGRGPLGGLYTGLITARTGVALLVGCDTPFLQPALLAAVLQAGVGRDAAMPRLDGIAQTLQAVYSRRSLPAVEGLMSPLAHPPSAPARPGLRDLLPLVDVVYLDRDEVAAVDPAMLSFINVNSEADLHHARQLLEGGVP